MKMDTACQLNYVISVAYGNVEYKKYLENVENKLRAIENERRSQDEINGVLYKLIWSYVNNML